MTVDQPRTPPKRRFDDPAHIGFFNSARWGRVEVRRSSYAFGGLAVRLVGVDGSPIATLSTRLLGLAPRPPRFWAKTWSENEEIAREALAASPRLFVDTGERQQTGFVEAELWEIAPEVWRELG